MKKCLICGTNLKRLGLHIKFKHGLDTSKYYQSYIYVDKICYICEKHFRGNSDRKFCSISCVQKNMVIKGRIGKPAWNSGQNKYNNEKLKEIGKKISIANSGKKRNEKQKKNYSIAFKRDYALGKRKTWTQGLTADSNIKLKKAARKTKETRLKNGGYIVTEDMKRKISEALKESYKNGKIINPMKNKKHSIETKEKIRMKRKLQRIPTSNTKIEKWLIYILNKFNLPFQYVGNGKLWLGNKNPDFVHKNKKKVIEVFGNYWHSESIIGKSKEMHAIERKEFFESLGYECLIIWENEFYYNNWEHNILNKVKNFECS